MVTATNAQKTSLQTGLVAAMRGVSNQMQDLLGKAIPASVVSVEKNGTIVKVKMELKSQFTIPEITCAVSGPEYIRMPIQAGDKGMVIPSDYFLGAMTGIGTGTATLGRQMNLSTMVWHPIGNKNFEDLSDGEKDKVILYGPDGAVLKTAKGDKGKVDVSDKGVTIFSTTGDEKGNYVKMTDNGFEFFINGTLKFIIDGGGARMIGGPRPGGGNYGITVTDHGTQIDNFSWLNHIHQGVQPGSGNSQKINELVSPP